MIKQLLTDELNFEKRILDKLSKGRQGLSDLLLEISAEGKFYCRVPGTGTKKYIRKSNRKLIKQIAGSRFIKEKIRILENNVRCMEELLDQIRDYDDNSVIDALPATYAKAIAFLREHNDAPGIQQSENPKNRHELTVACSNGLMVRTKGEMIIAEILITLGIEFRYEKRLDLVEKITLADGSYRYKPKTVYPDFTIVLADGTELYWEHAGLFDTDNYRDSQHRKFNIYYDNGIYPPRNLIITMDGPGKSISSLEIRKIVEAMILPRL